MDGISVSISQVHLLTILVVLSTNSICTAVKQCHGYLRRHSVNSDTELLQIMSVFNSILVCVVLSKLVWRI